MTTKGSSSRGPSTRPSQRSAFEREFPGSSESANASVIDLVRTHEAVWSLQNAAMRPYGLSPGGREALAIIEGAGGSLSPSIIAKRLLVTTASTASLLDTLERRGFVTRHPASDDRRKVIVTLTDAGQAVVDAFLPQLVAVQTAALSRLSEADRAHLRKCLEVIRVTAATLDGESVGASAKPRVRPNRA
jgi:DNA-binding MarR family transcriptional regulator